MIKPYHQQVGQWGLIFSAGLLLTIHLLNQSGICFNTSGSMPVGIYKRTRMSSTTLIQPGMLVSFCPQGSLAFQLALKRHYLMPGSCPVGQAQPLLKPVVAVAGDTLTINPQGITVNGRFIASSHARSHDSQGRVVLKMPQGTYKVKAGEIWLVSSHSPRSFDSRYFGSVPLSQIQWIVQPILTGD
jgi:conjugative transfer signal peptidase TraF